jgi:dipeptidyl-peptidase-3
MDGVLPGAEDDRVAYDVAWVADKDSPVDTINGFIEVYMDARGVKGAWEGIVCFVNRDKTRSLQRLAEAAPWFEEHMPWDPQWRRPEVRGVARAIDVVVETSRPVRRSDQSAERSGDPRALRQQVNADQHHRGA